MTERRTDRPPELPPDPSRRRALHWLGGGLALTLLAELAWIVAAFLRPRARTGEARTRLVEAGPVERFAPGSVTPFPGGRFYLARLDDGGFLALDRTCTHLGCTVPWDAERGCFACPCHASTFDITGAVLSPPATRPLDHYPVRIENGVVRVDTARPLRRDASTPAQVART